MCVRVCRHCTRPAGKDMPAVGAAWKGCQSVGGRGTAREVLAHKTIIYRLVLYVTSKTERHALRRFGPGVGAGPDRSARAKMRNSRTRVRIVYTLRTSA